MGQCRELAGLQNVSCAMLARKIHLRNLERCPTYFTFVGQAKNQ